MTTSSKQVLTAALLALVVCVALFVRLHDSPIHLPHQGIHSVLAAKSLAEGRGLEVAPGQPYAKFGPGYPVVLSALSIVGLNVNSAVYAINCAALAGAMLGLFLLCRPVTPLGAWIVMGLYGLWAPNFYLLRGARPDMLVACLSILTLLATVNYARRGSPILLWTTIVCCTVAALCRYMVAVTLVPVVFAAMAATGRSEPRRRARDLVIFGIATATPFVAWLVRNYQRTGFLTGMSRTVGRHGESGEGLPGNLIDLLRTVQIDAFAGDALGIRQVLHGPDPPGFNWAAALALAAVAVLISVLWSQRDRVRERLCEPSSCGTPLGLAAPVLLVYITWYVVALLAIWSVSNNDPINTRYLAPVYGQVMALATMLLAPALHRCGTVWPRLALVVLLGTLVLQSSGRVLRLLRDGPPGARLVNVIGSESNWVRDLSWEELDPNRLLRATPNRE